jgi:hypothetical protein
MMVRSPEKSFEPEELVLASALQTRAVPPFLGEVRKFLFFMFAVSVRAADPDSLSDWLERMRPDRSPRLRVSEGDGVRDD